MLNQVLDGLEAKPTHAKWAAMGKCSEDRALRDNNDLLARGVLHKFDSRGRNAHVFFGQKGL